MDHILYIFWKQATYYSLSFPLNALLAARVDNSCSGSIILSKSNNGIYILQTATGKFV